VSDKRFDIFFEKHIGFGIRWDNYADELTISIAIPFVTFTAVVGKKS